MLRHGSTSEAERLRPAAGRGESLARTSPVCARFCPVPQGSSALPVASPDKPHPTTHSHQLISCKFSLQAFHLQAFSTQPPGHRLIFCKFPACFAFSAHSFPLISVHFRSKQKIWMLEFSTQHSYLHTQIIQLSLSH